MRAEPASGEHVLAHYAAARYVLLYLDGQKKLGAYYRAVRDEGASLTDWMTDDAFLQWIDTLRWPRRS